MFLEYVTDSPHAVNRLDRFMAAWQLDKNPREITAATPYSMIDSGQQIRYGDQDFQTEYRKMIEDELPRPPLAIVSAVREQPDPGSLMVHAQVTNISTSTLQTSLNGAAVHVMVYEGNRALKAGTEVKASSIAWFDEPLAPGETASFEFSFRNLRGVNLSAAEAAVLVDYQPPGDRGRWDMMQAAIATGGALPPIPTALPTPTDEPTRAPPPTATSQPTSAPAVTGTPTADAEAPVARCFAYVPALLRRYGFP